MSSLRETRHDHEPENDNVILFDSKFKDEWLIYDKRTLTVCEAAKQRQRGQQAAWDPGLGSRLTP